MRLVLASGHRNKKDKHQTAGHELPTDRQTGRSAVRPFQKVLERDVIIGPLISSDDRKPFKSLEHERAVR